MNLVLLAIYDIVTLSANIVYLFDSIESSIKSLSEPVSCSWSIVFPLWVNGMDASGVLVYEYIPERCAT